MQLTKNIVVETGYPGANVSCIITGDGLVLVDSPHWPSDAMTWKKEVEGRGTARYLINTENHTDHTMGASFFSVPVIAQEKTRDGILALNVKQIVESVAQNDPKGLHLVTDLKLNIPAITFSERMVLYMGKLSFHLFHLPGHSPGQTAVLIPEERVIFTGDNVCNNVQGFFHEADPYKWLESLKRLEQMEFDTIVPGHGEPCDKSYLKKEAEFVQECIDIMKKALAQGWSKEEIMARVSFEKYPMDKGIGDFGKVLLNWSVSNMYAVLSRAKN
jgi:cyclase